MTEREQLANFIHGEWRRPAGERLTVLNPATAESLAQVSLSPASEVSRAVEAGAAAFEAWRRTPAIERVQVLFSLARLLREHLDELARGITIECGKTLDEARGELQRGIENVEAACGIPSLMQGYLNEEIARGIDESMVRQPLGVVAAVTPFNFPAMIPLWFLPYAIACGNAFILKPSERAPITMQRVFGLIEQLDLPPGVVQLVNGGRETVEALIDHPGVRAVSFVGSTPVARAVYARAAARGKRAQCQGGAKNPIVVLPDADMEMTARITADSAFGCAGQRCLAASVAIAVGEAHRPFVERMSAEAESRRTGNGLDPEIEMGPVISAASKERIEQLIARGVEAGGRLLVDGRGAQVPGCEDGFFVRPTLLDEVPAGSELAGTEIFGPVLSLMHAPDVDTAIRLVNERAFGNMACLFTTSGASARRFRSEARAGNIGINLGVAAPMAFFPFSGWGDSFFGDLHAQGRDAVEFYTDKKVVIERWPREWSRRF